MRITHTWTELTASIGIEGLPGPVRIMHVGDTHLDLIDDRDADFIDHCRGIGMRFARRHQYRDPQGQPFSTEYAFVATIREAQSRKVDLIVHSGDLVDFPARASIDRAVAILDGAGIPWLYTSGDHDWFFFPMGLSPGLRERWWPVLDRLTAGRPACGQRDVLGIRFLTVDDTTYQISEEQLAFTQEALSGGLPTVVVMHVPLSIATLRRASIEKRRHTNLLADPDWPLAQRQAVCIGTDTAATREFVRTLTGAENLAAVLAGHLHFLHADAVHPRAVQYVAPPNYAALHRLIEFHPLRNG